jgi:Trehalose and maltose hydrolases (possible phosphorylases)
VTNLWQIREEIFTPQLKQILSQETVFTVGNGYFGTRGTFEEGYPHATPATLLYGVFDAIPTGKEELANIPDWTGIQLFVNGERFRLDQGKILSYERVLDLKTATLVRTVRWESPSGVRLHVVSERFASLADEHTGIIRYSVTVEQNSEQQEDVHVQLRAGLNTAQGNYGLMHWETTDQANVKDTIWLTSETLKSQVTLAQVFSLSTATTSLQRSVVDSDIAPAIYLDGPLVTGTTLTVEKVVVMYTSRDEGDPLSNALTHHAQLFTGHEDTPMYLYETLLAQQTAAWHDFWQEADVVIEGDAKAQLGIRYSIYQLRINVSSHDDRYSVAAKGLTGFGYRGHIFHDTEIFMLPFYTYVFPAIARNLLLYRYHLLPAARQKAHANGYNGAQFPWESTLDGKEATPSAIIHPESGELIPVLNGTIELHITSSIAYATYQYWSASGDDAFLRDYGAELLISTALFWDSRAEQHGDHYDISNVIGPDEWHEHVKNNAYTNYMAQDNIQNALRVYEWLQSNAPTKAQELATQLGLDDKRIAHMHDVCEHLRYSLDEKSGLIEQFEGFFKLEHLDQSKYAGRTDSYQGIFGMKEIQKYQIVKQADTLMMLTLLREKFDQRIKAANWNYYFPITDHDYGSSLTPAFHAILASELNHPADAYNLYMKGALVDLENQRGNTAEGVHCACAGAVWQAAIFGIAGLHVDDTGYTTNPCWPEGWQRLAFTFQHKGQTIHVDLRRA